MVQEKTIKNKKILVISGTTGVGKTDLALELSDKLDMEVISADSMQIYISLDAGTAKPSKEELKRCRHHMIDVVAPMNSYNVYEYTEDVLQIIQDIWAREKLPVIVGGTGLYIESLLNRYKFNDLEKNSLPDCDVRVIVLNRDREKLYMRINDRVDKMIEKGLVEEVKKLREIGVSMKHQCMQAIGYKEIWSYLEGEITLEQAVNNIKTNSRRYAKRQLTWFRHMNCEWVDVDKDRAMLIANLCEYYNDYKK